MLPWLSRKAKVTGQGGACSRVGQENRVDAGRLRAVHDTEEGEVVDNSDHRFGGTRVSHSKKQRAGDDQRLGRQMLTHGRSSEVFSRSIGAESL
jgi:hypothetical protein